MEGREKEGRGRACRGAHVIAKDRNQPCVAEQNLVSSPAPPLPRAHAVLALSSGGAQGRFYLGLRRVNWLIMSTWSPSVVSLPGRSPPLLVASSPRRLSSPLSLLSCAAAHCALVIIAAVVYSRSVGGPRACRLQMANLRDATLCLRRSGSCRSR